MSLYKKNPLEKASQSLSVTLFYELMTLFVKRCGDNLCFYVITRKFYILTNMILSVFSILSIILQ